VNGFVELECSSRMFLQSMMHDIRQRKACRASPMRASIGATARASSSRPLCPVTQALAAQGAYFWREEFASAVANTCSNERMMPLCSRLDLQMSTHDICSLGFLGR
jgi:hypothetical protein